MKDSKPPNSPAHREIQVVEWPEDAITAEEMGPAPWTSNGYDPAALPIAVESPSSSSSPRNAFTELMARPISPPPSKHPRPAKTPLSLTSILARFPGRNALGAYTSRPEAFPSPPIISVSPDFVTIYDAYPKSSIHTLLLPRLPSHNLLHPYLAFDDPVFLASCRVAAAQLRRYVASILQRRHSHLSATDRIHAAATTKPPTPCISPPRDWASQVLVGIHAHPSMGHVHIHVLSVDMVGVALKRRNHYNSFTNPFFVPLADFPLAHDDIRRSHAKDGDWIHADMRCWRCGRHFGGKMVELKRHLAEEFEAWRRE